MINNVNNFIESRWKELLTTLLFGFFLLITMQSIQVSITHPNKSPLNKDVSLDFREEEVLEKDLETESETDPSVHSNLKLHNLTQNAESDKSYDIDKSYVQNLNTEQINQEINDYLKEVEQNVIDEQRATGFGIKERERLDELNTENKNKTNEELDPSKTQLEAIVKNNKISVSGIASVRFLLDNRHNTLPLEKGTYVCLGGGKIVVNIVVNQNGYVTNAKYNGSSSTTSEECLIKKCVEFAKKSRFNASINSPKNQKGTITYIALKK